MIKFVVPAVILFLVVLFWEKINKIIYKKTKVRVNYIVFSVVLIILLAILVLLYF